jgi:hypothetical protein
LTPDNPKSNGTEWHLEGIEQERIICTGIYYLNAENITNCNLKFRTALIETELNYYQNSHENVVHHYGLNRTNNNRSSHEIFESTMELGSINTNKVSSLVFPNCFQHKLEPFELLNKTEDGSRLIVVFFLVDPNVKIVSSDIVDNSNISTKNAKKFRKILMFDRKFELDEQSNFFDKREFTLCEH